ncbi:MAG TPA: GntR family transcriptional regulator [Ktedonobacteraceae bacterium]
MDAERATLQFYLDSHSGVAPYLQLVQQVKQGLRLGFLNPGDQLPTVREVVAHLAVNPNTVFKAYRTLELEGLVKSRPGLGTFILRALMDSGLESHVVLRQQLETWLQDAYAAGLQEESIEALFDNTLQEYKKRHQEESA